MKQTDPMKLRDKAVNKGGKVKDVSTIFGGRGDGEGSILEGG